VCKIAEADKHENDPFEPDNAVIHLRLGDTLRSYIIELASLSMRPIQTISIVTIPFDVDAVKHGGIPVIERSKKIAHYLVIITAKIPCCCHKSQPPRRDFSPSLFSFDTSGLGIHLWPGQILRIPSSCQS
jgi:hypothetical protein